MAKERRAYSNYPEHLQTRQNNRETFIADDPLFEPEQADFLNGYIGDTSILTEEDLARTPPIVETTPERQKYQLVVGSTYIDPDSQERLSMASYQDMVRQIEANGGDVSDPNRVFATEFYAWTPPIDYDKHINFSRYVWVGEGTADVQGEYVTKEPEHSKTVVHTWDGTDLTPSDVIISDGLPPILPAGTFVEDASDDSRFIYLSDGVTWNMVDLEIVDDVPTSFPDPMDQLPPIYYYVTRTGPDFQRPLVWRYSEAAGRWIPQSVVVSLSEPEVPRPGMVWEDARLLGERILKVFNNGVFGPLTYTLGEGPTGAPGSDGDYIYDTREYSALTDEWSRDNWWRHQEDLSPVDQAARSQDDPGIRPIIEFWAGLEPAVGDTKDFRNDAPRFKKYAVDPVSNSVIDTGETTTIFQYQVGAGNDDAVLGFPLSFNNTGEFLFDLTLELDTSAFAGYHYFRDLYTNFTHGIWSKSDVLTEQAIDSDGLYEIPVGISSNSDHAVLTTASRSRMLRHMTGIISEQDAFQGNEFGANSYRWSPRNATIGSTIIDAEKTHLRTLATLQDTALDLPNAIRRMAKEYNKVLFRFTNRMNQMWDDTTLTSNTMNLRTGISVAQACDAILTAQFVGRVTDDFPFFYSDMGTYLQTLIEAGAPAVIDSNPVPILIPPSATRVGASRCYVPSRFVERDGTVVLRGHEGITIPSFGDDRDLIWLELQNRFFAELPGDYCLEDGVFSARDDNSRFKLVDFYGNYVPNTALEPVDIVVTDFNGIGSPTDGMRVFSTAQGVFALFSGGQWLTTPAITDDIFFDMATNDYWIFNGQSTVQIADFDRPFEFEYTTNFFRTVIRREFERFIVFRGDDFTENTTFVSSDPFTWNYRSAGVEGHYLGIYQRIYNTTRPHSHPWEVMGYTVEPTWWRTQYVPTSTAPDGTPRYANTHPRCG